MQKVLLALAGAAGLVVGAVGVLALGGRGDEERTGQAVRNYLLTHPEILPEAMQVLEQRQAAAAIGPRRAQFETPYAGAWAGAADGDVVLVEFFDYACGFCRASNAVVDRLIAEDPRLRVVYRELPVLGPDSQAAAFASLAAADQGRYRQFYNALFEAGRPAPEAIARARALAGVNAEEPSPAHRQELARNMELASVIRANGTPTFVVGDQVFHGAVGYETLKRAIDQARARRAG
jgi:protein-disulfide isomerase